MFSPTQHRRYCTTKSTRISPLDAHDEMAIDLNALQRWLAQWYWFLDKMINIMNKKNLRELLEYTLIVPSIQDKPVDSVTNPNKIQAIKCLLKSSVFGLLEFFVLFCQLRNPYNEIRSMSIMSSLPRLFQKLIRLFSTFNSLDRYTAYTCLQI